MSPIMIRQASLSDLNALKSLADSHKNELGFVLRPALVKSIERAEVLVAENSGGIVGFVDFRHRKDSQTTLYHIAVQSTHQGAGIGRRLVDALVQDAGRFAKAFLQLKCPTDLGANGFYEHLGFSRVDVKPGKNRDLVIWQLPIDSSRFLEDKN